MAPECALNINFTYYAPICLSLYLPSGIIPSDSPKVCVHFLTLHANTCVLEFEAFYDDVFM
jgi:hypothetical protein